MLRDLLDPILADAAEGLGLGLLLGFRQLQLGHRPPLITGVNTLRTPAGVSIDLTLQLAGGSDVVVEAKAGAVSVCAELSDLAITGVFRVTLAALSPEFIPGFKALNITCVRKPDITFNLSAVEIPLTQIPGLSDAITDAVQSGVASAIVWPWSVTIPIYDITPAESSMLLDRSGDGVLRAVVVSGDNIPNPNTFRPPNTFARCTLNGAKPTQTRTVDGTANPVWGERMEWVVHDWATATFECELADRGKVTQIVKPLGKASVDLASLRPFIIQPLRLKLPNGGHVTLQLKYCPFASFDAGWHIPETIVAACETTHSQLGASARVEEDRGSPLSSALLYIEVLGCSGLPTDVTTPVCVSTRSTVHKTLGSVGNGQAQENGEALFCPVQSLATPIEIYLDDSKLSDARARVYLFNAHGNATVSSTPRVQELKLHTRQAGTVRLTVKIALKLPVQLETPAESFESYAARYDVSAEESLSSGAAALLFQDAVGLGNDEDWKTYLLAAGTVVVAYIAVMLFSSVASLVFSTLLVGGSVALVVLGSPVSSGDSSLFGSTGFFNSAVPGTSGAPAEVATVLPDRTELDQSLLLQQMPLWMTHPDAIKSEWCNDILELLWPTLCPSLERSITANIVWGLEGLSIKLKSFTLGTQPPTVTAIKCYPQTVRGTSVLLDFSIELGGSIGLDLSVDFGPVSIPIVARDVFSQCVLRLELGPPVAEVPPIAGIKVLLVEPSGFDVDLDLFVGGCRVTTLPGLQWIFRNLVLTELMRFMYIPYGIEVPFGTVSVYGEDVPEHGVGLLRVHVRRAIGLPQQAMTVQSALGLATVRPVALIEIVDPTSGRSTVRRIQTQPAISPINPVWDERLEILVPNKVAILRLGVVNGLVDADTDVPYLGKARDIAVGAEFAPNAVTHCATALSTPLGSVGTLQVDIDWKPFVHPYIPLPRPVHNADEVFDWSVGAIFVTVVGVRGLENSGSISHVKITTGGETRQTRCKKGVNPDFNTNVHFLVQYVPQTKVRVLVVNHKSGNPIGDVQFNVSDVVQSGGKQAGVWDLHGSDNVKIELALEFRGVSGVAEEASSLFVNANAAEYSVPPPTPPLPTPTATPSRQSKADSRMSMGMGMSTPFLQDTGFSLVAAAAGVAISRFGLDGTSPPRSTGGPRRVSEPNLSVSPNVSRTSSKPSQ